ncbi:MAG: sulfatase [Anaerolineae bacterium]
MNIIFFISDTYRQDNLSCYGPTRVQTPRLDQFASQSYIFENAYLGSFPTIPNRMDIMSGRFSFIDREWSPLPEHLVTLQQILTASDVVTYMIADNPHLLEMGFNFSRGFNGFEWIRGQETDLWKTSPKNLRLPDGRKNRSRDFIMKNYLRNVSWWKSEEDRFVARTVRAACEWLEENQDQDQFFLYIDTFDPHEPWDAPQKYLDLYETGYAGEELTYPHYDFWREFLTEEELNHYRALYMAEASMVDHWFGVLLDKVDELGLQEDTAVVFLSDHGFLFGEHDLIGKSLMPEVEGGMFLYEAIPMYNEIRRVPLLIHLPQQTDSKRINALVQHPDLMPTILEMAGLVASELIGGQTRTQLLQCGMFTTSDWEFRPENIHGKSLMPLLHGEVDRLRDVVVCSNTLVHHSPVLAKCAIVTEDGWCLHYSGTYDKVEEGGAMYTNVLRAPDVALIPTQPALYHLPTDPQESKDVIDDNEQLAQEIHERYVRWLEEVSTPEEHLIGRRKLR